MVNDGSNGFVEGELIPGPEENPINLSQESEKEQSDNNFYATGVKALESPDGVERVGQMFDQVEEEYKTQGYSALVNQVRSEFLEEQDLENKEAMQALIDDPTLTKDQKRPLLKNYVYGFEPSSELKDKYIKTTSNLAIQDMEGDEVLEMDLSIDKVNLIQESQKLGISFQKQIQAIKLGDPQGNYLNSDPALALKKLGELQPGFLQFLDMSDEELEADEGFFYRLGKNVLQVVNALAVELPPYVFELLSVPAAQSGSASGFLDETPELEEARKSWTATREHVRKLYQQEPEKVWGIFNDYEGVGGLGDAALNWRDFWHTVLTVGGLVASEEEFDNFIAKESWTQSTFETIDEGFLWVAEKITPEDPEKSKVFLEMASFFTLWGVRKGKALAVRTNKRVQLTSKYNKSVADLFDAIDNTELAPLKPFEPMSDAFHEVSRIDTNSPLVTTMASNRKIGDALMVDAIQDTTGRTAGTLGTTRTKLTSLAFSPLMGILNKPAHMDMHQWSLDNALFNQMGESYFGNEGFMFAEQRKTWIRDTDGVLDNITAGVDIYQKNSESIFRTTEGGLKASIVFGKLPDSNYRNLNEASVAYDVIREKTAEAGKKEYTVTVEQTGRMGEVLHRYKDMKEAMADPRFKVPVDSIENLQKKVDQIKYERSETVKNLKNKKEVEYQAELNNVSVAEYLKTAKSRLKLRDVELNDTIAALNTAKQVGDATPWTPNLRVRVTREGDWFDAGQAVSDGYNKPPVRTNIITKAIFSSDKFWNWMVQFGKINKKLEETFHGSGLRSQAWLKNQLQDVQVLVTKLNTAERAQLQTLYLKQQGLIDYATVPQIREMLGQPNLEAATAYKLQTVLHKTRALDKFRFDAENIFEMNRLSADGYNTSFRTNVASLKNPEGLHEGYNVIVKDQFVWTLENQPPEVMDFANGKPVPNPVKAVNVDAKTRQLFRYDEVLKKDVGTGQKIYKLAHNYYTPDGKVYTHGVFGKQKESAMPQQVIDSLSGHMPMIMTGSKFVRRYPKRIEIDGKPIDYIKKFNDGLVEGDVNFTKYLEEMQSYKQAVMMAPTELAARRWLEGNEGGLDHTNYHYRIEDALEINNIDRIEAQTIRENAMKASVQRSHLEVAKAQYEDLFASFVMATESNGSRAYLQPLITEYKNRWLDTYYRTDLVTLDGIPDASAGGSKSSSFPQTEGQIKARLTQEGSHKNAIQEFRQIMMLDQGHPANWIGESISKTAGRLAELADRPQKSSLLEQHLQKWAARFYRLQTKPSLVQNTPMRATSILKIQLQMPMWHWMIQTANSFGHLAVGGYAGFNRQTLQNYYRTAHTSSAIVAEMVLQKFDMTKNRPAILEGIQWMEEQTGKKYDPSGMLEISAKDRQLIIQEGLQSGFFHIADHTFSKNFFKQGAKKLTDSTFSRRSGAVGEWLGTVGFEQGELMGRVNSWNAARLVWQQNNKGLNWRNPVALSEITAGARKLAGSMDAYGEMAIQRTPVLATFAQFSSFLMKSGEGMWNDAGTPFSFNQRVAFSAWNFGVYGIRGGMWYGSFELLRTAIAQIVGEENVDEAMLVVDDYTLLNVLGNNFLDAVKPTYNDKGELMRSDLEFNMRFSPMGADMPFGAYGAMWKYIFGEGLGSQSFGPSGSLIKDIVGKNGILDMLQALYSDPVNDITQTKDQIWGSIQAVAKLTGVTSGVVRYILMQSANDKRGKTGQYSGESVTEGERDLFGWTSVSSKEERLKYEFFANKKNRKEAIKSLADEMYRGLILTMGDNPSAGDTTSLLRGLKATLDGSQWLSVQEAEMLKTELTLMNDRGKTTSADNIFTRAIQDNIVLQRNNPKTIANMKMLREMAKNHKSTKFYDQLDHIIIMMENNNTNMSEEENLEMRQKLHKQGELY